MTNEKSQLSQEKTIYTHKQCDSELSYSVTQFFQECENRFTIILYYIYII